MQNNEKEPIRDVSYEIIEPQPTGALAPANFGEEYGVDYGLDPEDLGNFSFYQTGNLSLLGSSADIRKYGRYPLVEPLESGGFELKSLGSIRRSEFDPVYGLNY